MSLLTIKKSGAKNRARRDPRIREPQEGIRVKNMGNLGAIREVRSQEVAEEDRPRLVSLDRRSYTTCQGSEEEFVLSEKTEVGRACRL